MKTIHLIIGLICCVTLMTACKNKKADKRPPLKEAPTASQLITPPTLFSNRENKASCIYLSKGPKQQIYVSWVEIDSSKQKHFYFAGFNKEKQQIEGVKNIPIEQNASIHEEGMPKMTVKGNGDLFAIYETSSPMEGSKWGLGDIRYIQSTDKGKTWSTPKSLAPKYLKAKLSGGFPNFGRLSNGEIGIAWLGTFKDPHKEGRPIEFTVTNAQGGVEPPITISKQGCECCRTAVTGDKNGKTYVAFRDLLPGSIRDISLAVSSDNGKTFEKAYSFSGDQWKVAGCPHNGPSLVQSGQHLFAAWFTDAPKHRGVNVAVLDSTGQKTTQYNLSKDGQFIQVGLLGPGEPIAAYNEIYEQKDTIYSRIVAVRWTSKQILKKEITPAKVDANYPMLMGIGNHQALLTWRDDVHAYYQIIDEKGLDEEGLKSSSYLSLNNKLIP